MPDAPAEFPRAGGGARRRERRTTQPAAVFPWRDLTSLTVRRFPLEEVHYPDFPATSVERPERHRPDEGFP